MNIKKIFVLATLILNLVNSNAAGAQSYRILITNDDGIDSPLLAPLAQELSQISGVEILVSAPSENQSGSSQSSIGDPLVVKRVVLEGASVAYSVGGKPADAVRFGIVELGKEQDFDLVVSGINRGANVGDISHLSGTVGAAMEAIYQGVPAIAVSQEIFDVDTAASAKFVAQLVALYKDRGAPQDTVISINIPAGELIGVAVRPMGDSYFQTSAYQLEQETEGQLLYERELNRIESEDPTTDTYAYQRGYITITPLKFDWTAHELLDEVRNWDLQLTN